MSYPSIPGSVDFGDWTLDYDREDWNESDGKHFYGSDNDDNTTDWYDDRGDYDSTTPTPE